MNKSESNKLENYALFFEEIGPKAYEPHAIDEELAHSEYDTPPSLTADQICELTKDIQEHTGSEDEPTSEQLPL